MDAGILMNLFDFIAPVMRVITIKWLELLARLNINGPLDNHTDQLIKQEIFRIADKAVSDFVLQYGGSETEFPKYKDIRFGPEIKVVRNTTSDIHVEAGNYSCKHNKTEDKTIDECIECRTLSPLTEWQNWYFMINVLVHEILHAKSKYRVFPTTLYEG